MLLAQQAGVPCRGRRRQAAIVGQLGAALLILAVFFSGGLKAQSTSVLEWNYASGVASSVKHAGVSTATANFQVQSGITGFTGTVTGGYYAVGSWTSTANSTLTTASSTTPQTGVKQIYSTFALKTPVTGDWSSMRVVLDYYRPTSTAASPGTVRAYLTWNEGGTWKNRYSAATTLSTTVNAWQTGLSLALNTGSTAPAASALAGNTFLLVLQFSNVSNTTNSVYVDNVKFQVNSLSASDYGDWNGSGAATSTATSTANSNLRLGATVDAETAATTNATAAGDDTTNTGSADDEDGVTMPVSITSGANASLPISVYNNTGANAYLNAWIDFNNDGTFNDTLVTSGGERLEAVRTVGTGTVATTQTISFTVPSNALAGAQRGVRVRLTDQTTMTPTGTTGTGEIEDYTVTINPGADCYQVLVANYNVNTVMKIDGPTGTVNGTLITGGSLANPSELLSSADGTLLVSNYTANSILKYNTFTGALSSTLVSAGSGGLNEAQAMALGSDGYLYVASAASGAVIRYSASSGALVGTFITVSGPSGLAFDTAGNLYVLSNSNSKLFKYNSSGSLVGTVYTWPVGTALHGLVFGPDGNLYCNAVSGTTPTVDKITTAGVRTVFTTLDAGSDPYPLAWAPDGTLWVGDSVENEVTVYNSAGTLQRTITNAGFNNICGLVVTPCGSTGLDYGDLKMPYPSLLAQNGPRHVANGILKLGATIDADGDGQPNSGATGDDIDSDGDDDDGVTFPTLTAGATASVTVNANAAGKLNAFFDWNNDGDFLDTNEAITQMNVASGNNTLSVAVPSTAITGTPIGARFRVSTAGGLTSVGGALDGEVEDYMVTIVPAVTITLGNLVWNDLDQDGVYDTGEPGVDGVTVDLWQDPDGAGALPDTKVASTVTSGGGFYSFTRPPGTGYTLEIVTPPSGLPVASGNATDYTDNGVDNDSNGYQPAGPGTSSWTAVFNLTANGEPGTSGTTNIENTWDFGFRALPNPTALLEYRFETTSPVIPVTPAVKSACITTTSQLQATANGLTTTTVAENGPIRSGSNGVDVTSISAIYNTALEATRTSLTPITKTLYSTFTFAAGSVGSIGNAYADFCPDANGTKYVRFFLTWHDGTAYRTAWTNTGTMAPVTWTSVDLPFVNGTALPTGSALAGKTFLLEAAIWGGSSSHIITVDNLILGGTCGILTSDFGDHYFSSTSSASQAASTLLKIGTAATDPELTDPSDVGADKDDLSSTDDEDLVMPVLTAGTTTTLSVPVTATLASLSGAAARAIVFADWNGDGDVADANETLAVQTVANGTNTLSFGLTPPAGTVPGTKYLRIRVSETTATPAFSGTSSLVGEVEDYAINVIGATAVGNLVWADANDNGRFDAGEGVGGVQVQLLNTSNAVVAVTTTDPVGLYQIWAAAGTYYLKIPASEFASGRPLFGKYSLLGNGGDNGRDDEWDENGIDDAAPATNGIRTPNFTLTAGSEPTTKEVGQDSGWDNGAAGRPADNNADLTQDFGFAPCLQTNLITNGSFETANPTSLTFPHRFPNTASDPIISVNSFSTYGTTDVAGWFRDPGAYINDATHASDGSRFIYLTGGCIGQDFAINTTIAGMNTVTAGQAYTLQFEWCAFDHNQPISPNVADTRTVRVELHFVNAKTGVEYPVIETEDYSDTKTGNPNVFTSLSPWSNLNWKRSRYQFIMPPTVTGASVARVYLTSNGNTANNTILLDNVMLTTACLPQTCTVGNFVYSDTNGNGRADVGEPGIDDVLLQAFRVDASGTWNWAGLCVTREGGRYFFPGLLPGNYYIRVEAENFLPATPWWKTSGTGSLYAKISSGGYFNPEVVPASALDDNASLVSDKGVDDAAVTTNGISTPLFALSVAGEPTTGASGTDKENGFMADLDISADRNGDMTIDFGFSNPGKDYGDWNGSGAGDPYWSASSGLRLGALVDSESASTRNSTATGDDTTGVDDEDGVTWPTMSAGGSYRIPVVTTNNTTQSAYLQGWVDWNNNGTFETSEAIWTEWGTMNWIAPSTSEPSTWTQRSMPYTAVPVGAVTGVPLGARVRMTTFYQDPPSPTGSGSDFGEIEDYTVTLQARGYDHGDFASFADAATLTNPALTIGQLVDAESSAVTNATATGDDNNNNDDEDGIYSGLIYQGQASAQLIVNVNNTSGAAGYLNVWVDFNGNGVLTDSGEQIATNLSIANGTTYFDQPINFAVPAGALVGTRGVRVRLTSVASPGPTGTTVSTTTGEVEDGRVIIQAAPFNTCYHFALKDLNHDGDFVDGGETTPNNTYVGTDYWVGFDSINANWQLDPGESAKGWFDNMDMKYDRVTQQLTVDVTVAKNRGNEVNGLYFAVNDGPMPTASNNLALIYMDGWNGASPVVTVYKYDPAQSSNTFANRQLMVSTATGGPNAADVVSKSVTKTATSTRFQLVLNCARINNAANWSSYGVSAGTWSGVQFTNTVGIWIHSNAMTAAPTYDASGQLTSGSLGGWRDEEVFLDSNPSISFPAELCPQDYGDWNGSGAATTVASSTMNSLLRIGGTVDTESSVVPNSAADTDDVTQTGSLDDEDGVNLPLSISPGASATISAYVNNTTGSNAFLHAWIDFNNDGTFNDTVLSGANGGERLEAVRTIGTGTTITTAQNITFTVPAAASVGTGRGLRVRLSNVNNTTPTAVSGSGEIEDYTISIAAAGNLSVGNLVWRDDDNDGVKDAAEPGLDGVTVQLFKTTDNYIGNADDVQQGSNVTTAGGGLYSFSSLPAGTYYVKIPTPPAGYTMSSGVPDGFGTPSAFAENDQNDDNNGVHVTGIGTAVTSGLVTLSVGGESTVDGDTDANTNLTVDFGFTAAQTCPTYLAWPDWRTLTRTAPTAGTGWMSQPLVVNSSYTSQTFSNVLGTGAAVTVTYTNNMFDTKTPNIYVPRWDPTYDNVNTVSNPNDVQCNPMFFGGLRFTNNSGDTSASVTTGVGTSTGHAKVEISFDKDVFMDEFQLGSIGMIGTAREWAFVRAYDSVGTGVAPVSITGQTVSCEAVVAGTGPSVVNNGAAGAYLGGLDDQNAATPVYGNASFAWTTTPIRKIEIQFWRSNNTSIWSSASTGGQASAAIRKLCFRPVPTLDYGDWAGGTVPANAQTTTASSIVNSNVRLGLFVDAESSVVPDILATADNLNGTDDEEGGAVPKILIQGTVAYLSASVFNNNTTGKYLQVWIDFNNDGTFNNTDVTSGGERVYNAVTPASASNQAINFSFTVPANASVGYNRGVRFRYSDNAATTPTSTGAVGEIEDFEVRIVAAPTEDFGDWNGSGALTTTTSSTVNSNLRIGATVDAEASVTPDAAASADGADEDGVWFAPSVTVGSYAQLSVKATNLTGAAAYLNAWVDFNGNGTFDVGEQVATNVTVPTGTTNYDPAAYNAGNSLYQYYRLQFPVPASASVGTGRGVRVRLTNIQNPGATGAAGTGEVEDYTMAFTAAGPCYHFRLADANADVVFNPATEITPAQTNAPIYWDNNNDIGTYKELDASFNPTTKLFNFDCTVLQKTATGVRADGIWFMINTGPLPLQTPVKRYAMIYIDAFNRASPKATVYVEDSLQHGSSWSSPAYLMVSTAPGGANASDVKVLSVTEDTTAKTVRFRLTLDCSRINDRAQWPVAWGLDADWRGLQFLGNCGMWCTATDMTAAPTYDASGKATAMNMAASSYLGIDVHPMGFTPLLTETCNYDFGDHFFAITSSASQLASADIKIGTNATDAEGDISDSGATLDDNTGADDEDLTMPVFSVGSATNLVVPVTIPVLANLSGSTSRIGAWVDWNGDGDVADANETLAAQTVATAGTSNVTFSLTPPAGTTVGFKYLRIRITEGGTAPSFSGAVALKGEVEDYAVQVCTGGTVVWTVDEDADAPGHLHLWSFDSYDTPTISAKDYGRMSYRHPTSGLIMDVGESLDDLESVAINRYTGDAYFLISSSITGGPSNSQTLFTYNLNDAATNVGNIILTVLGHLTRPTSGIAVESLAYDPVGGRLYSADPLDGNQNASTTTDNLLSLDIRNLNANTMAATSWTIVGPMTGASQTCNYTDGMEITNAGKLYAIDGTDEHVYEVNPSTGAIVLVSDASVIGGLTGTPDIETLVWDEVNSRLIGVDNNTSAANGHRFVEVTLGSTGANVARGQFLPGTPGLPSDADFEGAAMWNTCPPQPQLGVGNLVFKDLNSDGNYDSGEGMANVIVDLYAQGQTVGTSVPVARTKTDASGKYGFNRLLPGNYFIHIPASNFGAGQPLVGLVSMTGTGTGDDNTGEDGVDNAAPATNGISSAVFNLADNSEPTNSTELGFANTDDDADDNNTDLTIDFGFVPPPSLDFGDWNGSGASTTTVTATINSNLSLGASVDSESSVAANAAATTDDTTGSDDEDGVTMPASITQGGVVTIPVSVVNRTGAIRYLHSWIDFNNDGTFNNALVTSAGERLESVRSISSDASAQALSVSFTVPGSASAGTQRGVRFRISDSSTTTPTTVGGAGEIEDYVVTINTATMSIGNVLYYDNNNNATYDTGDVGVPGAVVQLYNSSNTLVGSTTTTNTTSSTPGIALEQAHSSVYINTIAGAVACLGGTNRSAYWTGTGTKINYLVPGDVDGHTTTGNLDFPTGSSQGYVIRATGTITIPTAGAWTFLTTNDDAARLQIDGSNVILDDSGLHSVADKFGTVTLTAGSHTFEYIYLGVWGGSAELYAQAGTFSTWNTGFKLVGDTANGGLAANMTAPSPNNGKYLFTGLAPGSYYVKVPASEFASGKPLYRKESVVTITPTPTDDNVDDNLTTGSGDDGIDVADPTASGVSSPLITLTAGAEPINSGSETGFGNTDDDAADYNGNMTIDFGFRQATTGCWHWAVRDADHDGYIESYTPPQAIDFTHFSTVANIDTIDMTFHTGTKRYTYDAIFAQKSGKRLDGFYMVVGNGPEPWGKTQEAIMYVDLFNRNSPKVTMYVYDPTLYDYTSGDTAISYTNRKMLASSQTANSPIQVWCTESGSTLKVHITADLSGVNNYATPAYSTYGLTSSWEGFRFDANAGIWSHYYDLLGAPVYDAQYQLTSWNYNASDFWGTITALDTHSGLPIITENLCEEKVGVGNVVFKDANGDGNYDSGEGVDNVLVYLYKQGQIAGVDMPAGAVLTYGGGKFLFSGLSQGSYFLHIPSSEFGTGKPLVGTLSLPGTGSADDNVDENGLDVISPATSGVSTAVFTLTANSLPMDAASESGFDATSDNSDDDNTDLTQDLGFRAATSAGIGNLVFFDNNNNGRYDAGDAGVGGVKVELVNNSTSAVVSTVTTDSAPVTQPGFAVTQMNTGSTIVTSYATANTQLAGANGTNSLSTTGLTLNYLQPGKADGHFTSGNSAFPYGSFTNFVVRATGTITIPIAGTWSFGMSMDDGGRLRIDGADVIVDDSQHPVQDRFGSKSLTAGTHSIEVTYWGYLGDDTLEVFAAQGTYTSWNSAFKLIGDTASGGLTVTTTPTSSSAGRYVFSGISAGTYYVRIPASEFGSGKPLNGYASFVNGSPTDDQKDDNSATGSADSGIDNAAPATNGIVSAPITLALGAEPTTAGGETGFLSSDDDALDSNYDLTVDFAMVSATADNGDYAGFASASQAADTAIRIGTVATDGEPAGSANATATSDDIGGTDDEDLAMPVFTVGSATTLAVPMTVTAASLSGGTARVNVFVDWNGDNDVADANETSTVQTVSASGTFNFSLTPPVGTTLGTKFLRIRAAEGATHPGFSGSSTLKGEVEDYSIAVGYDFGDAPAPYPSASAAAANPAIGLGPTIDYEATQAADDGADEDGFFAVNQIVPGKDFHFNIHQKVLAGSSYVNVWIDWNRDGDFADAGEQVVTNRVQTANSFGTDSGASFYSIAVPSTASVGATWVRVRINSTADASHSGATSDGEVEDHPVTIQDAVNIGGVVWLDANNNGQYLSPEVLLPGVPVRLLDASSNVLEATLTNASGAYTFIVPPGSYIIQIANPLSGSLTPAIKDSGSDATDSDFDTSTGRTVTISVASGAADQTDWDAGFVPAFGVRCVGASTSLSTTNISTTLNVPKFSTANGTLTGINILRTSAERRGYWFQNHGPSTSTVTYSDDITRSYTLPNGSTVSNAVSTDTQSDSLAGVTAATALLGTGTTGYSRPARFTTNITAGTYAGPLSDFIGASNAAIGVSVVADSVSFTTGGNSASQVRTQSNDGVIVCYTYSPQDVGDYSGFASATQVADGAIRIGTNPTDGETTATTDATATADDVADYDDEDLTMPAFTVGSTTTLAVPMTITAASLSGSTARVNVFVDWNGDNDVADANETLVAQTVSASGTFNFSLTPPAGTASGTKYLRIRATEGATAPAFSGASTLKGEVEDYAVTVNAPATDFGDHIGFPSASQMASSRIRIGTNATDGEAANPTTGTANADDTTGTDDEDLVLPALVPGKDATLSIPVTLTGLTQGSIGAWVDWNGDGDVADTGEVLTLSTTSLVAGSQTVTATLSPPESKTPVTAYLRVRVTDGTTAPAFSGASLLDGEVEDYALSATCPTITLTPASLSNGNVGSPYSVTILGNGGTAPYDFAISGGTVPPDLKFNPATGELTGTPTTAGTYSFTVLAVDASRCEGSKTYSLTIVSSTTDYGDLPDPGVGTATGNYNTLSTDNGAWHTVDSLTRLGLTVDGEGQALANAFASGDGADEDGVISWPNFQRGSTVVLPVSVFHNGAAATVYLRAFVDWNNDGDFLDASETITAVSVAKSASQQTINLSITVPATAALECVGLRLRVSALGTLTATGAGDVGEVEDYFITVLNSGSLLDYGDHIFGSSANSASNIASNVIKLGATAPDAEAADPATSGATADDLTGNDEDYDDMGSVVAGDLMTGSITVTTCSAMPVASIGVWVDWNGDGDVADAGEVVLQSNSLVPGVNNLFTAFSPPVGTTPGVKYVRYRVQEGATLPSFSGSSTLKGEVEDGIIAVTAPTLDYGDCSLLPPAWNTANATLRLGTVATDVEGAATTNAAATADDLTGADDEDGVTLSAAYASGMTSQVTIRVTNTSGANAYLSGWIDFNNTPGTVEANEIIINNVTVATGTSGTVQTYTFTVPSGITTTRDVCARFRLSSVSGTGISGTGGNGEVEDYLVKICPAQACTVTGVVKN